MDTNALLLPAKGDPEPFYLETLVHAQKIVGGYVQVVEDRNNRVILCNEDASFQSLPRNEHVSLYLGDIIVINSETLEALPFD